MAKVGPFEKYSGRNENWFAKNKFAYQSEIQAVKKLLPDKGEGIEIGVGSGRFAGPLGIKIGVEPSGKLGRLAKRRRIRVIQAVAEELPFDDSKFDFVLMVTTICFVDDARSACREAYRILKPGGHIVIGFVNKASALGKLYQEHKTHSVFYKEATFFSTKEVVSCLKKAGFRRFSFMQTLFSKLDRNKNR